MAGAALLALVGAAPAQAAISYVSRNSTASTNATLTIARPSGTTSNDVLVATVSGAGTAIMDAPSGWTLIRDTTTADNAMRTMTFFKVATASESSSYSFTTASARNWTGGMIALRGANSAVPIDAVAGARGGSGNVVAPLVTTTSAAEWVITSVAVARNATFTPASGTTERYERAGTSTSNEMATATQTLPGATPTRTVVPSSTSADWTAHTIAVRDAATAGLSVTLGSASESFSADLDTGDSTETYTVDAIVEDTRTGAGAGWQLQITSTTLTTGTRSLSTSATSVTGMSVAACDNGAPCTLPDNSVTYPVDVPAGTVAPTAAPFANADATTGRGRIDWAATFSVAVPQNAFAGSYTSTVTISIISGP